MSNHTSNTDDRAQATDRTSALSESTSRRTFLKATAAGAAASGLTATTVGTVASQGIPTPFLERDGNLIRNSENGEKVILRGVNIADPRRLDETAPARGKNARQVIDYATDESAGWYSRVVRLPVHPGDIAGLPPIPEADTSVHTPVTFTREELEAYIENHLDPAVDRCEERGAYAIVDYHRHWGTGTLPWDDPTLSEEVTMFWDVVAEHYAGRDNVIFEMYNEPTHPQMGSTPIVNDWSAGIWSDWIDACQPWIDTIRGHADNLTIVGSPMWSQYPEGALVQEPEGDNLGYVYHIYPTHGVSQDEAWEGTIEGEGDQAEDQNNGEAVYGCYEEVPLFVTEFGWQDGSPTGSGTVSGFGEPFFDWLNDNPIHWTGWCFDPAWLPSAVKRSFDAGGAQDSVGDPYSEEIPVYCEDLPCEWEPRPDPHMGEFMKQQLYDNRNSDVPTNGGTGPTEPTSPSGWTTDVGQTTVEMGWDSVSNADHYNVFRDGTPAGEPTGTTFTIDGLDPETTYTIGLEAENDAGTSARQTTDVTTLDGTTPVCEGAEGGSTTVDGQTVCDVNDDGYYRDVTGDGSVGQGDVAEFFSKQHRDAWKQPDLFDFSGNGAVTHGDVVELADYVALN